MREEETSVGVVTELVRAIDMRDAYTSSHSEAVGELARRVGVRLGLSGRELWELAQAARLHDIGKVAVPDAILNKPGPLDHGEWNVIKGHAELGGELVGRVRGLEPVARFVRSHHERWDGGGYPDGLAGDAIPLASRVIGACDAFHAMTTDRPYRGAIAVADAVAELEAGAGTQFDPDVVEAIRAEMVPAAM